MSDTVVLHTGVEVQRAMPGATLLRLEQLADEPNGLLAVFDLIQMAHDHSYRPFGKNGQTLIDAGLLTPDERLEACDAEVLRALYDKPDALSPVLVQRNPLTGAKVHRIDVMSALLG